MYSPVDKSVLYSAHRLYMSFADEYGREKPLKTGTCFFVTSADDIFLVTNRHNLEAGYSNPSKREWSLRSLEVSGYDSDSKFFKAKVSEFSGPIFPENFDEDVAMLRPKIFDFPSEVVPKLRLRHIQREVIADEGFLNQVDASEQVVFPGYPAWYDHHEHRPIMRSGIISSDPSSNYTGPGDTPGARRIAFEGFSFDGSSGSPVILMPFGFNAGEGLTGMRFRHQRLIGINTGHQNEQRTGLHSGISRMIKSTAILELLDLALTGAL